MRGSPAVTFIVGALPARVSEGEDQRSVSPFPSAGDVEGHRVLASMISLRDDTAVVGSGNPGPAGKSHATSACCHGGAQHPVGARDIARAGCRGGDRLIAELLAFLSTVMALVR